MSRVRPQDYLIGRKGVKRLPSKNTSNVPKYFNIQLQFTQKRANWNDLHMRFPMKASTASKLSMNTTTTKDIPWT